MQIFKHKNSTKSKTLVFLREYPISKLLYLKKKSMESIVYSGSWERIDSRLSKQFSLSRNFFQHILKRGGVMVNNKQAKKSYQLEEGDSIDVDSFERFLDQQALDETPNVDIPRIYERDDYLILNKPKWVLAHPKTIRDLHEPSVAGFLYHNYKHLPSIGNFMRAGILHRLDKQTDGLMIIAKTERGLAHFKKLFQQKSESESMEDKESTLLKKFYRAYVEVSQQWKVFLDQISNELPWVIKSLVIPKLPHAISKIWITKILSYEIDSDGKRATIQLEILTGRTHQIRYHLSQAGLPIVGDYLYGKDTWEPMWLTAYKLIFQDPDWAIKEFSI